MFTRKKIESGSNRKLHWNKRSINLTNFKKKNDLPTKLNAFLVALHVTKDGPYGRIRARHDDSRDKGP